MAFGDRSGYAHTDARYPRAFAVTIVYQATNIWNGKRYIGVTSKPLPLRIRQHRARAQAGDKRGRFPAALRKYGFDAFEWRILAACDSVSEAQAKEVKLIAELRPEYNVSAGGEYGINGLPPRKMSAKAKANLRELGLKNKKKWRKYAALGPKAIARPVVCLNDGQKFPSAVAAARAKGVKGNVVTQVCGRKRASAGGLVFRYAEEPNLGALEASAILAMARYNRGNRARAMIKAVICVTDGAKFENAAEASIKYKVHKSQITAVCNGRRNVVHGLVFRYL